MTRDNNMSKVGLVFLAGAAVGVAASLFMSDSTRQKGKKAISRRVKQIETLLVDKDEQERLLSIFNSKSEDVKEAYHEVKQRINESLANLSEVVSDIDKEKYTDIVSNAIASLKKGRFSLDQRKKLQKELEGDYQKLQYAKEEQESESEQ